MKPRHRESKNENEKTQLDQVEKNSADFALQVAKKVAERVDGPANGDNRAPSDQLG